MAYDRLRPLDQAQVIRALKEVEVLEEHHRYEYCKAQGRILYHPLIGKWCAECKIVVKEGG